MKYRELLQAVNTVKALTLLKLANESNGQYVKFDCPEIGCDGKVSIKAYGDKKNLYYCPKCTSAGNIIGLVMKVRNVSWKDAVEFLQKATDESSPRITQELNINYELFYNDFIKEKGISEDICRLMEIGVPKGKTMLSGTAAFAVRNEEGIKIAYYGIKMKDGKAVFHKSFNPELYLYNFCNLDLRDTVYLTNDIFSCVRMIQEGKQAVCNFGLPYISQPQMELLDKVGSLVVKVDNELLTAFAIQMAKDYNQFYRFETM